jgi:hypothetical protein
VTSALDGGEWSASHPGRFTAEVRVYGTHCVGDWVDPKAILDSTVGKNPLTVSGIELWICSPSVISVELSQVYVIAHKQSA